MSLSTVIKNKLVHVGDTVQVYQKIKEEDKIRTQVFEGIVIAIKGRELGKSFTVRKMAAAGIGVERIWPIMTPSISKITVIKRGNPRRSKLYYLRNLIGKERQSVRSEGKQTQSEPQESGSQG